MLWAVVDDSLAPSEEAEAPMYLNHPRETLEVREADRRGNRESYLPELQRFARDTPPDEEDITEITENNNITTPKSFFDDDSDEESAARSRASRLLKKSFSNLKVGTSNFLARSRAGGGGSGGSEETSGRNVALGISRMEQTTERAVIGLPTDLRRLGTPRGKISPSLVRLPGCC